MYIKRDIEKVLLQAAESFQVITLYGSRQVGKTTTVKQLFGSEFAKAPKLYFTDTGLCAYLCKWPTAEMLRVHLRFPFHWWEFEHR